MTTKFVTLSQVKIGGNYILIQFRPGIKVSDIMMGEMSSDNIDSYQNLGKLVEIRQYGRSYDPDFVLYFEVEKGKCFEFEPTFGFKEGFIEYDDDTEEMSKERTRERTKILEQYITGNDWALRPDNVVLTQGIDLNQWAT